jgi:hypothetical protein
MEQVEKAEEDVQYISLEFPQYRGTNLLSTFQSYSLIGLETDTPILQLDGMIFQGSWEHVIGTRLFFEPNGEGNAEYRCKTMKKIVFKQGQLVPITSSKTATETETTTKTSTSTDMATEQST